MCTACDARRGMLEATGPRPTDKLPRCRGRHPHLDAFYRCDEPGRLMMLGAANQWFSSTLGLLALPREEHASADGARAPVIAGAARADARERRRRSRGDLRFFRDAGRAAAQTDASTTSTRTCSVEAVQIAGEGRRRRRSRVDESSATDPLTVLLARNGTSSPTSRSTRGTAARPTSEPCAETCRVALTSVRLRGGGGREAQEGQRLHRLHPDRRASTASTTRPPESRRSPGTARPTWVPGDRGPRRGRLPAVRRGGDRRHWEAQVLQRPGLGAFRDAHRLNFERRTSKTAGAHRSRRAASRRPDTGRSTRSRIC